MPGQRRGGRGGGTRAPLPRDVQVSKKLSWLLRHGAEKEGLDLDAGGFLNVQDVLSNRNFRSLKVTFDELAELVKENDKKRFSMIHISATDDDQTATALPSKPQDWKIRANQGHSLKLDAEGEDGDGALLTPISADDSPITAVHGTTHAKWPLIVASGGLKPMGRNHVHFASGLPAGFQSIVDQQKDGVDAAAPVISGMRSTSTVLIFLDVEKALDGGLKFGRSENGVILTAGDDDGLVPLKFFQRVEDRTGEGVLVEDGKIVKEAPTKWAGRAKDKG